jgi:cytosine deaminase
LKGTTFPFDVGDQRVIFYEDKLGGETPAVGAIQEALEAASNDSGFTDSPVFRALPDRADERRKTPSWVAEAGWPVKNGRIVSPLDGEWVEILDRRENMQIVRHYSLFRFEHNPGSEGDPFRMVGYSFRADGTSHSSWSTEYLRVIIPANKLGVRVEYIYRADVDRGEAKLGFGVSSFHHNGRFKPEKGLGHYLAGEEEPVYRCDYRLQRLSQSYREQAKLPATSFDKHSLSRLIPRLHKFETAARRSATGPTLTSDPFLRAAINAAKDGAKEGGLPIGSVLVIDGEIVSRGHNRRIQQGSPILHAEMDCLNNAGRLSAGEYGRAVLYSTLSPCHMCSGAALLYKIPKIVIGENVNFKGPEDDLRKNNINLDIRQDKECIALMRKFIGKASGLVVRRHRRTRYGRELKPTGRSCGFHAVIRTTASVRRICGCCA